MLPINPISITEISDSKLEFPKEYNIKLNIAIKMFVQKLTDKGQSIEYYEKKRNAPLNKVENDMFLGKKTEFFAAFDLFKNYGFPWLKPDLTIYLPGKKGWDADLPYHKLDSQLPDVHVKGCSRETCNFCNDYSWTFQYKNNNNLFGRDKIFLTPNNYDLVSLVFMETIQENKAVIKAILPLPILKKYLKPPIKQNIRDMKKCIYYNDLIRS